MYYAIVATLMLTFPALSIAIDASMLQTNVSWFLIGKWCVFWMVGVRLLLAGLRQIAQPKYTAEKILGIKAEEASIVIRELGFANAAFGVAGVASLFAQGWVTPLALAGGIFYGLAGINHVLHSHRNRLQSVAMISDLFAAALLLTYCVTVLKIF